MLCLCLTRPGLDRGQFGFLGSSRRRLHDCRGGPLERAFPMRAVVPCLSAIFLAPRRALLLGRAVLVEVVELAAREHLVETGRGGVAAAEAVATTRAPSLSRCATMMASSWSRTWGGGSSISRLNLFHFRQSRVPKVQNDPDWYEIERENLHGLVVVYSQLYWAPSLPSRAKAAAVKPRCSALQKHL